MRGTREATNFLNEATWKQFTKIQLLCNAELGTDFVEKKKKHISSFKRKTFLQNNKLCKLPGDTTLLKVTTYKYHVRSVRRVETVCHRRPCRTVKLRGTKQQLGDRGTCVGKPTPEDCTREFLQKIYSQQCHTIIEK